MDGVGLPPAIGRHERPNARPPAPGRGRGPRVGVRPAREVVIYAALEGARPRQVRSPAPLLDTERPGLQVLQIQAGVGVPGPVGRATGLLETVRVVQAAVATGPVAAEAGPFGRPA